jgi:hypothetical protein
MADCLLYVAWGKGGGRYGYVRLVVAPNILGALFMFCSLRQGEGEVKVRFVYI